MSELNEFVQEEIENKLLSDFHNDGVTVKIPEINRDDVQAKKTVDIYSSINKGYITAIDIDNSNNSVNEIIEDRKAKFIKKRLRQIVKQLKDERAVDMNNPDKDSLVTEEEIKVIQDQIATDIETQKFVEECVVNINLQKINFAELRNTMNDLNDMNEFSAQIERLDLQKIDKFLTFEALIKQTFKLNDQFSDIIKQRRENIDRYCKEKDYDISNIPSIGIGKDKKFDVKKILETIEQLYLVTKNTDEIELYERFDMQTNIDYAHKLSDVLWLRYRDGDNYTNPINDTSIDNNNLIHTLVKQNIVTNRLLGNLLSDHFVTANRVTCYDNMYVTTFTNNATYPTRTLGEILLTITNKKLANISKETRKQIYMTYNGIRPSPDDYCYWNGLQIFDIDLKEWNGDIDNLKLKMYEKLQDFHWFLWICKSSSGKGLHVWTKVSPAHHVYNDIHENDYISKYWYKISYTTKLNIVYSVLDTLSKEPNNGIEFPDEFENAFVDNSVGRITSGIRLSYDANPLVNHNFADLHPSVFLHQTLDGKDNRKSAQQLFFRKDENINETNSENPVDNRMDTGTTGTNDSGDNCYSDIISTDNDRTTETGVENTGQCNTGVDVNVEQNEKNNPEKTRRKKGVNFNNTQLINQINGDLCVGDLKAYRKAQQESDNKIDISKFINIGGDVTEITPMERYKINYISRYNVCNTLAALFGKDGLEIAHIILDSKKCGNVNEINSFYSCALSNKKEASKLGLEILKQHGIIRNVSEEVKDVVEKTYKEKLKEKIEQATNNALNDVTFKMESNEYMSDFRNELHALLSNENINIILCPAGAGKTSYILNLAKAGKRIMLVLPYISVIKNKIETDKEITNYFDCYYGTKSLKDMEYGRNVVTTFDKFSRCNTEKVSRMFDYIVIDESHLLYASSYRIEATSNVMKRLKELYYISSNDMFASKIIMMTGTMTGESFFHQNNGNFITFSKKSHTKKMLFEICDDHLDALTRMASRAAKYIMDGVKLMIPTNKGDVYSEKLIGMIEYLIGRECKYGYYKRSNTEQEICRLINEENTVKDYDIIFCTNYLSVGIDINDKCDFASLYLGSFSGYEIEQFNARVRKTGIESSYFIITNKADGSTNDILLEEPSLVLRITDEDQLRFIDDKAIAGAKQEFVATFDPILHKITTPGFSMLNGKIQFNIDEYELLTFENKYNECQQHPVKVARELSRYGYDVSVSTEFDGLSKAEQEILKKLGIAAARDEKIRKHSLLVGTYLDLVKNNSYINEHGLGYENVVEWIGKNPDAIIEDRNMDCYVHVEFDVFATPQTCFVKSKEALDKMYKAARYMLRKYSVKRAIDIISNYVDENGILKQKNFQRAINLMKLIDSSDCGELAEPLSRMLEKMYIFVDDFEKNTRYKISYENYRATLDHWTNEYVDMLGIKIVSQYAFDKIRDSITEMLYDLATKEQTKAGVRFHYNKLDSFNSSSVINRRSIDQIIENMFELTSTIETSGKKIKEKHVILETQEF